MMKPFIPFRLARLTKWCWTVFFGGLLAFLPMQSSYAADNIVTYVTGGQSTGGSGVTGTYDSATNKYYQKVLKNEVNPNTGANTIKFMQYDMQSSTDGINYTFDKTLIDEGEVSLYTDDFDNYNNNISTNWTASSGTWQTATDGTGIYEQSGTGSGIASYNNGSSWTDYTVTADVKRGGNGVALLGRYQNASNFYQLILNATTWSLNKFVAGTWTTLATGAITTTTTDYYNVELVFSGTSIQAFIGGTNVATVTDSSFSSGTIGFRTNTGQGYFDNVRVIQHMLVDNFENGTSNWTVDQGTWQTHTVTYTNGNPNDTVYQQSGNGSGIVHAGSLNWTDYTMSAYVKRSGDGAAILGRYQDSTHFYQLVIKSSAWYLNKLVGGVWTTLTTGSYTFSTSNYYRLEMKFSGSTITLGIWDQNGTAIISSPDSATPVTLTDTSFSSGMVGLRASTGNAYFDNVAVGDVLADSKFESQHLIQSPVTGHWSIWSKRQYGTGEAAKNLMAITSINGKIDGDYALMYVGLPDGNPSGDIGLFTDDDANKTRYLVSADTTNGYINLYQLNADNDNFDLSASITGQTDGLINHIDCSTTGISCISPGGGHKIEAVSMIKYYGYYYIFGSGVSGWDPNQQQYTYATNLKGSWATCVKIGDASGFHSQLYFVSGVYGSTTNNFLFSATRNGQMWGGPSTNVYLPMYKNNPTLSPGNGFSFSTNYYDYTTVDYTTGFVKGYNFDIGTKLPISNVTAAYNDGTNVPANTIDGNDATYWINNNTQAGGVITFDLGAVHHVKAVKLRLDPDDANGNYKRVSHIKIEVGNGTTYTTVYDKDANGYGGVTAAMDWLQPIQLQDKTQSGQYVRISLTGANSEGASNYWFKIYEAEIWGDTSNATPVLNEDFTSDTVGTVPSSWTVTADPSTSGTVQQDGLDNRLELSDNSSAGHVTATRAFATEEGATVTAMMDFKVSSVGSGDAITFKSGSTHALTITNTANGLEFSDSLGNNQLVSTISANTWYRMKIDFNTDADTFDLYLSDPTDTNLDDNLVRGGGRLDLNSTDIPNLDSIQFQTSDTSSDQFWIDNVSVQGPL